MHTVEPLACGRLWALQTTYSCLLYFQDEIIQKARVAEDQGFTVTAALADQAAVDLSKVRSASAPCHRQ